jgi:hypothetical protein
MPSRRHFLASLAAPAAFACAAPRVRMAVATTCYRTERFRDTTEFLEHVNALGAGGIQAPLTGTTPDYLRKLRAALERYGMWIEVRAGIPKGDAAFTAMPSAAREVGAGCVRSACLRDGAMKAKIPWALENH